MPDYAEDLIYSLQHFLRNDAGFSAKDLTGVTVVQTGTLQTLFPSLVDGALGFADHFPAVQMYDLEALPLPSVGVDVEAASRPTRQGYGFESYRHNARFLVVGTSLVTADGKPLLETDYDASVVLTLNLKNCLEGRFREQDAEVVIPYYQVSFDNTGSAQLIGECLVLNFNSVRVAENRFVCTFNLEVND